MLFRTRRRTTAAPVRAHAGVAVTDPPDADGHLDESRQRAVQAMPATPMDADGEGDSSGSSPAPPLYFMDSPGEGERLERKTDPYQVGLHLLASGLRHDMQALDVACGTGAVTRVMAQITGPNQVIGVDASAARLKEARRLAAASGCDIQFLEGSADSLPVADGTSMFTHARMLFQYVRDPLAVLREMKRVTRPAGTVVVIDLDGQIASLHPLPDEVRCELNTALQLLQATGFDPYVGRKLFGFFHQVGLERIQARVEPYQVYVGGALSPRDRQNWSDKLDTATDFLVRTTGEAARWKRFHDAYLTCLQAPNAFYHATVMIVRGIVPSVS